MIDKLAPYAEAGVNRIILNMNFGASQAETLDSLQCFAEVVLPHFTGRPCPASAIEAAQ
jgi:hypothetical protein